MLAKLGTAELVLILALALIIFGPSRLPALGKMAGQAIGGLKRSVKKLETEWEEEAEGVEKEPVSAATTEEDTEKTVTGERHAEGGEA